MAQIHSLALYETRDPHAAEDITEMELPPERKQAVTLRFVNELSAREIVGKSEGAVRVLIRRALLSVRRRMEP